LPVLERACPACHTPLPMEAQFCMHCGVATPTDPGVPPRIAATGAVEIALVTKKLAGRYKIERILGEGGMATVYLAEDVKHRRKVAVKVMRPELAATLGADRFLREVEIAARLTHPHILPLYDSGEADGLLYFVMPHVEGDTLKDYLQKVGTLPADEALRLAREVTEALAYAHARGIIHRDIKPANIMVSAGHALVADFGIARAVGDGGDALTKTGLAVGTPQYMSPEQATGEKEIDGRADVYATGAVLYEMLAGEPPFTGPSARVILTRSLTEAPRPLSVARTGLPASVDTAVMKALAKNPSDRYATAATFMGALDEARQHTSGAITVASSAASHPTPAQGSALPATTVVPAARARPQWMSLRNGAMAAGALLVLWAVGATFLAARRGTGAASGPHGNRVAVLAFTNQGPAADEYFADGISDEVRGKLARVAGLSVIASGSAAEYKNSTLPVGEIAKQLGADYVLTGKVRWASGDNGKRRVQVVPELIDAHSGDVKWQQTFDPSDLSDIFAVQSQIATRVAGALGVALGGATERDLASKPTSNPEAYQLYLKGRAVTGTDPASMREAVGYLEQAVALDSTFADAWALLSLSNTRLYANGTKAPEVGLRAHEALDRTATLAPNSSQAHLAAARYYQLVDINPARSREEMDLALRISPGDPDVLSLAGLMDMNQGDLGSALSKLERAREVDPRSYSTTYNLANTYMNLGRLADAEAAFAAAVILRPTDKQAVQFCAVMHMARGDVEGAHAVLKTAQTAGLSLPALAVQLSGFQENSWMLDDADRAVVFRLSPSGFDNDRAWWGQSLATAYMQAGDKTRARAYADSSLATSAAQAKATPGDPQLAVLYGQMLAMTGHPTEAHTEMNRALHMDLTLNNRTYIRTVAVRTELAIGNVNGALDHIEWLHKQPYYFTSAYLQLDPTFSSLKGNPRFDAMLKSQ
jgi:eukaryotic-like serine/threonine-protein kinase